MLVLQSKKQIIKQKLASQKRILLIINATYITTPEFNKLTAENFAARLAKANLVTKTDFDHKLTSLNRKISSNKTRHLVTENELKK